MLYIIKFLREEENVIFKKSLYKLSFPVNTWIIGGMASVGWPVF